MSKETISAWACEEFAGAQLGDVRRTRRLVRMAATVAATPSGRVSQVFTETREREGAYDLLQNEHVRAEDVAQAMFRATAARVQGAGWVYVSIDGSSLNLSDPEGAKGFGRIGSNERGGRGLKVMNALAITPDGVAQGLIEQQYWSRSGSATPHARNQKRNRERPFADKETARFVKAATRSVERLQAASVRAWVVIDREADNRDILLGVFELPCQVTVRGNWERLVVGKNPKASIRSVLAAQPILGTYEVELGRNGQRAARIATMNVRAKEVQLRLFEKHGKGEETRLQVTAVWVTETQASARRVAGRPLEWLLYTNVSVTNSDQAHAVVQSYACRWRLEEFHRTWKTGTCQVEDMQLRSVETATIWATILSANAARIERLKYLSRHKPDTPASCELAPIELETLVHIQKQKPKPAFEGPVTIQLATLWIAELGGWISTNGPPGAITLSRGLRRLTDLTRGFELARIVLRK
jgi:Transposase DNA-binding/Transposase DDE domain